MLSELQPWEFDVFVSLAYPMALDPEIAGYPAYFDGIKTEADFVQRSRKAFELDNEKILLFRCEDAFCGWIHFYYLKEDRYLGIVSMAAKQETERMLDEFLTYTETYASEAMISLGFPEDNRTARDHLLKRGFTVEEESWNLVLSLPGAERYDLPSNSVIPIGPENYSLFDVLHAGQDGRMYWDRRRIRKHLEQWTIFAAPGEGKPVGTIYAMRGNKLSEIFGIDFSDGVCRPELQTTLLQAVIRSLKDAGGEYLVFFCGEDEKPAACQCGFTCVGRYILLERNARDGR